MLPYFRAYVRACNSSERVMFAKEATVYSRKQAAFPVWTREHADMDPGKILTDLFAASTATKATVG